MNTPNHKNTKHCVSYLSLSRCVSLLKGAPKPVAMEPCSGGKAAVLTVLMRLPSGPSDLPPPGQSGNTHKKHITVGVCYSCVRSIIFSEFISKKGHFSEKTLYTISEFN